jgi:hypothetical protein
MNENSNYSFSDMCRKFDIYIATAKSCNDKDQKLQDSRGRPLAINLMHMKDISDTSEQAEKQFKPLNNSEITSLIHDKAKVSSEDRNIVYEDITVPTTLKIK